MPPPKKTKFPCGVCKKECNNNSVGCGECDSWFHYNCQNLKHHPIEELQTLPLEFICIDCCTRWGHFQFQHSLQRLSLAASESMTALKNAARMEHMLLCDHTIYAAETITPLGLPQDFVSNQVWQINARSKHLQMATAFSTQRLLPRSETRPRLQNFVYLHALRCLNIQTTIKGSIRLQVAVVEYIGPYPDNISIHGNAKSANSEYVRTTPTVMTNIKDKIEVQQPREVYTTLTLDGSTCAPRDLKQVQNAKYQQKKPNLQTRNLQTTPTTYNIFCQFLVTILTCRKIYS